MEHKSRTQAEHRGRAKEILSKAGVKSIADTAVRKHERHDHPGAKPTKLASGGKVKHAGPKTVNVIVQHGDTDGARQQGVQQGMQAGAQMGAKAAMAKMAGGAPGGPGGPPPMGGPVGGGAMPPTGAMQPPGAMRPGMASGGRVKMDAGAASGLGRLEKGKAYGAKGPETVKVKSHVRRKRGGACD